MTRCGCAARKAKMHSKRTEIVEMLEQGVPIGDIVERLGVSRQYVYRTKQYERERETLVRDTKNVQKMINGETCVYPGIAEYIIKNFRGRRRDFMRSLPINENTLRRVLGGKALPKKDLIDAVCKATGMTYEEAFGNVIVRGD